mmetsp:Transcript_2874/g.6598  ORF Transcript_2874/g.6598 Transcript_2874/m.6598 type:complete len:271 (+) Transcript_2874:62-874(+)
MQARAQAETGCRRSGEGRPLDGANGESSGEMSGEHVVASERECIGEIPLGSFRGRCVMRVPPRSPRQEEISIRIRCPSSFCERSIDESTQFSLSASESLVTPCSPRWLSWRLIFLKVEFFLSPAEMRSRPLSLKLLKVRLMSLNALFCARLGPRNSAPASSMALQARLSSSSAVFLAMASARWAVFCILMPLDARFSRFRLRLSPMLCASATAPSSHMWFLDRSSTVSVVFPAMAALRPTAPGPRMPLSLRRNVCSVLFLCRAMPICSAP